MPWLNVTGYTNCVYIIVEFVSSVNREINVFLHKLSVALFTQYLRGKERGSILHNIYVP